MGAQETDKQILDKEWIELLKEAFLLGISIEEIRSYLQHNRSL
ncbi:anti-repressor SinI family protein [Niallia sp. Krafla_26]